MKTKLHINLLPYSYIVTQKNVFVKGTTSQLGENMLYDPIDYSKLELDQLTEAMLQQMWQDFMNVYGKKPVDLTDARVNKKTTNPLDFHCKFAKQAEELTKYSLLSNRPERQIEYELRSMGI